MTIENVYSISGRGTVVTGRVERGVVMCGDEVEIVGLTDTDERPRRVVCTGTQVFRKDVPRAEAGMNVGLLLRGVRHAEVQRGQMIAAPGSILPHARMTCTFMALGAGEGGRRKPFAVGYAPQLFFGANDVTGRVTEIEGAAVVMPGDRRNLSFDLHAAVGLETGMRFAAREGGRTIGAGIVTGVG